jgi:dipeptidyl aminopeptidase/acylaminoacyl peptidase
MRRIFLVGLLVLASAFLPLPPCRLTFLGWLSGEPCYRSKPVSYWRFQVSDWRVDHWRRPESAAERLQERAEQLRDIEFVAVSDYPGRWTLEHRNTPANEWYDKWQGRNNWLNPVYGAPFCRLAILDGDPDAVPVLKMLLKDQDVRTRRVAAAALGRIGPRGKAAFPALLETANGDEDAFLRGIARLALLDIDGQAAQAAGVSEYFMFWSPQPKLRATMVGRFAPSHANFSVDRTLLALERKDGRIQLHQTANGTELPWTRGHPTLRWPVAFNPDGKTMAAANGDRGIKLCDLASGAEQVTLEGRVGKVDCLAFSPDGQAFALTGRGRRVALCDAASGTKLASFQGHADSINCLAFSPDGTILASGSDDKTVILWDVSGRRQRRILQGRHSFFGYVSCLAFSPDGKVLASGSRDYTVRLWDVATGRERATLQGYDEDSWVDSVAFSPDGNLVASVSRDTIFLWDAATGEKIAALDGQTENVFSAVFRPDGTLLAVGGDDEAVRLWEITAVPPPHGGGR